MKYLVLTCCSIFLFGFWNTTFAAEEIKTEVPVLTQNNVASVSAGQTAPVVDSNAIGQFIKLQKPDIAEIAEKATVLIENHATASATIGTGFFITSSTVVTNKHVIFGITNPASLTIKLNEKVYSIKDSIRFNQVDDLVILETNETSENYLSLGDSDKVRKGDDCYVSGNPNGYLGNFTAGIITQNKLKNVRPGMSTDRVMLTDASISPGSSGSPVLDVRANVIGIVFAMDQAGQNLNLIIPVNALKQIIN